MWMWEGPRLLDADHQTGRFMCYALVCLRQLVSDCFRRETKGTPKLMLGLRLPMKQSALTFSPSYSDGLSFLLTTSVTLPSPPPLGLRVTFGSMFTGGWPGQSSFDPV